MRYIIIGLLLYIQTSALSAKEVTVTQLFNVTTVTVKEFSYAKNIKSYGFVRVDDARVYDVAPRFGGFVEVLFADKIYQKVQKAQTLLKAYSPEVLKAKDDYLNTLNYIKKSPNDTMLRNARLKLKLLNISDAEINDIKKYTSSPTYTNIISPANGYIFKKNINNNSAFNAKNILFRIVNLDKVWIEAKIHQDQLVLLKDIDVFTLTTPAFTQSFQAKIAQLYPELDEKNESFTLRLEVQNKNHLLKPGMYTTLTMSSAKKTYLTLPNTAVIRKNGTFYVFIVGEYEGEYEPLEIEVEALNSDTYTIKSGLEIGDEVVNNALFMMDSDAQINGLY